MFACATRTHNVYVCVCVYVQHDSEVPLSRFSRQHYSYCVCMFDPRQPIPPPASFPPKPIPCFRYPPNHASHKSTPNRHRFTCVCIVSHTLIFQPFSCAVYTYFSSIFPTFSPPDFLVYIQIFINAKYIVGVRLRGICVCVCKNRCLCGMRGSGYYYDGVL